MEPSTVSDETSGESSVEPQRERLRATSGDVLVIDQFMLGNSQFVTPLQDLLREKAAGPERREAVKELALRYGGTIVERDRGTYLVYRDPEMTVMILFQIDADVDASVTEDSEHAYKTDIDELYDAREEAECRGHVFVDTGCLVFVDLDLLTDDDLLQRYRRLRQEGNQKEARDLLRGRGAMARYGFNRYGDELGIFDVEASGEIALWPDIA